MKNRYKWYWEGKDLEYWREAMIINMWDYFVPSYWLDSPHPIKRRMPKWVREFRDSCATMD